VPSTVLLVCARVAQRRPLAAQSDKQLK